MQKNKSFSIVFKVHNVPIGTMVGNPTFSELERFKRIVAEECELTVDEIEISMDEIPELSEIDVTEFGLMDWRDTQGNILNGSIVRLVDWDTIFDNLKNQDELETCFKLK
jgi:hypothetical protein